MKAHIRKDSTASKEMREKLFPTSTQKRNFHVPDMLVNQKPRNISTRKYLLFVLPNLKIRCLVVQRKYNFGANSSFEKYFFTK